MTTEATVRGAQTVSIRRANGSIQQINRDEVERYLSRGWSLDTVVTIGNGVYNVILERGHHPNRSKVQADIEYEISGGVVLARLRDEIGWTTMPFRAGEYPSAARLEEAIRRRLLALASPNGSRG